MKLLISILLISCYIHPVPPYLLLTGRSSQEFDVENQLFIDQSSTKKREKLLKEVKVHSIDIVIATLYLAGGLSFFSPTVRQNSDLSASMLWIVSSTTSLALVVRKLYS